MALDITLTTPLSDTLNLVSLQGQEAISETFSFELEFTCSNSSIDFSQILGHAITLTFSLPGGQSQYLNGVVTFFGQGGQSERGDTTYCARLEPWTALLRMNMVQRIFQNQTVPQILEAVFSALGLSDYKNALTGTYSARDYCVQFGESTFDFISRLMESEGIFYFFTHTSSAHTMVLADDASAFVALPGITTLQFGHTGRSWENVDVIVDGRIEQRMVPNQVSADDFNFVTPATDLYSVSTGSASGTYASVLALYQYPGLFQARDAGETATGIALTSFEAQQQQFVGESMCRAFQAGAKFTLAGHYRSDANATWVLRGVRHHLDYRNDSYTNQFVAFPSTTTFRPPQVTPRAQVRGTQTAIVVGKSGEEIWTDQYGRIKVKFHWDQSTAQDDTCSCWIRVAQGWAGQQWGSIFIPRVGQEVLVSFLNGDPDRPIVTGCVFNGQQTTPYTLPDNQTRSTIKTSSSKGNSGNNELCFEDKQGSEEIFLQAQKDLTLNVLGDQTSTIANNRSVTVSQKDETLTVSQGNRTVAVTQGNETHTVGGTRSITVTGNESHTNQAKFTQSVTGDFSLSVSGNLSISVDGSISISSGTSFSQKAGSSLSIQSDGSISSTANASHSVQSSGTLELKGSLVQIN